MPASPVPAPHHQGMVQSLGWCLLAALLDILHICVGQLWYWYHSTMLCVCTALQLMLRSPCSAVPPLHGCVWFQGLQFLRQLEGTQPVGHRLPFHSLGCTSSRPGCLSFPGYLNRRGGYIAIAAYCTWRGALVKSWVSLTGGTWQDNTKALEVSSVSRCIVLHHSSFEV